MDSLVVNDTCKHPITKLKRHFVYGEIIQMHTILASSCKEERNDGRARGAQFPGRRITVGAPKSPNNVTSTFFNTVHLLLKDLRFEHGGAKLASCP